MPNLTPDFRSLMDEAAAAAASHGLGKLGKVKVMEARPSSSASLKLSQLQLQLIALSAYLQHIIVFYVAPPSSSSSSQAAQSNIPREIMDLDWKQPAIALAILQAYITLLESGISNVLSSSSASAALPPPPLLLDEKLSILEESFPPKSSTAHNLNFHKAIVQARLTKLLATSKERLAILKERGGANGGRNSTSSSRFKGNNISRSSTPKVPSSPSKIPAVLMASPIGSPSRSGDKPENGAPPPQLRNRNIPSTPSYTTPTTAAQQQFNNNNGPASDDEDDTQELSHDMKMFLERENERMLEELEGQLDLVRNATQSLHQVSEIQSTLSQHLLQNQEKVTFLHTNAENQVADIAGGLKHLKKAQKTFGEGNKWWVLYVFITLSLLLLIFDAIFS